MSRRTIVFARAADLAAAAVLDRGVLIDFLIEAAPFHLAPGAVLGAAVSRRLKAQGAWVVQLPEGRNGFLRTARSLDPGERIAVQVSGYAEPGKLAPVTDRIELRDRYAVVTYLRDGINISRKIKDKTARHRLKQTAERARREGGPGVVLRSSALHACESELASEIGALSEDIDRIKAARGQYSVKLIREAPGVLNRAVAAWGDEDFNIDAGDDSFARHEICEHLEPFRQTESALPNGGNIVIEPTRTLVAVDVNSGADTTAKAGLKSNLAAVRALPTQLRVRGLGGQIVVDFAPVRTDERDVVRTSLAQAFRDDRVATTLVGWTGLGHFEMHRHRDRLPLEHWKQQ